MSPRRALLAAILAFSAAAAAQDGCSPYVESHAGNETAALRPHTDAFRACTIAEEPYRRLVADWLAARGGDAPPPRSLGLGRAVNLPWISAHIARAARRHPRWDAARGRDRKGDINGLVAALLAHPDFLRRLDAPFAGTPWAVRAVSVEKVLVARAKDVLPDAGTGRVPYDAQLWLVIGQRTPAPGMEK